MCTMGGKCIWAYIAGVGFPMSKRSGRALSRGAYRLRTLEYIIRRFNFIQEITESYSALLRMRVSLSK